MPEEQVKQITIDMTPTWEGVAPILIAALEKGSEEGRSSARKEVKRMAKLVDMLGGVIEERDDLLAALENLLNAVRSNHEGGKPRTQDEIFALAWAPAAALVSKIRGEKKEIGYGHL